MPLYDFECPECGTRTERACRVGERESQHCDTCGLVMKQLITIPKDGDWFKPGYWRDFDLEPIYVRSRGHLKQLCKQYGVQSRALD